MTIANKKLNKKTMKYFFNDGGRERAGYKGITGDCVVRAIAIVTEQDYQKVYDDINKLGLSERTGKRKKDKSNSRTGVYKSTTKKYMEKIGWKWTPTMFIGSGCNVHLKESELPSGKLLVKVSKHATAVIDGVINDISDCSRNETRCVYGYFSK